MQYTQFEHQVTGDDLAADLIVCRQLHTQFVELMSDINTQISDK